MTTTTTTYDVPVALTSDEKTRAHRWMDHHPLALLDGDPFSRAETNRLDYYRWLYRQGRLPC